ncbi:MAG: putative fluoride ion transporter CrcB [Verrucomicrobiota bacterium]|jgi:CrcB protein
MGTEFWKHAAAVVVGGGVGAFLRFAVGAWVVHHHPGAKFPWATLAVNWVGCLLIGLIYGWVEDRAMLGVSLRYFLITGLLGGFTTFSAFGMETLYMFKRGESLMAWSYVMASVAGGIILAWLGEKILR